MTLLASTDIHKPQTFNTFLISPPTFVVTGVAEDARPTKNRVEIDVSVALSPSPEQRAWFTVQQHQLLVEMMGRDWKRLPAYKNPQLTSEPED